MGGSFLIKIYKDNKQIIISTVIILIIFGSIKYSRDKELNESYTVEGKIIDCQMVNMSGACVVKVEYTTLEGKIKTTENTLYKENNCSVGKIVKLQYSTKSNLTNILE